MEWKTVKLGEVCDLIKNREKGVLIDKSNYVSTENMLPNKGGVVPSSISPYDGAIIYHPKDVLISNIRPYFKKIWFADKIGGCSGDVLCFRSNSKIDSTYLYYLLSQDSFFDYVMAGSKGTKMPRGDKGQIMQYEFPLPPLETQRRIAAILSSLDDKIENNNHINRNLEAQAQALFKSWFVDFEPWGGIMPDDWEEGTLGDIIAEIESGSRPKGGAQISGIPSIGAEKIERFGVYDFSGEKYVSEEFFNKMKRGHVNDGDVMLYKDGAYTGKCSMALDGFPYKECAVNEHVFLLRTEEAKYQFYLYLNMVQESVRSMIYTLACSKAAQPGLNTSEVLGVKTIIPTEAVMMDFNSKVANMMHTIANNCLESARLATLRDTLLPKLMKGEIAL